MPRIQAFAPGTRVTTEGKPSTSRVSSRATRKFSALRRNATPTHSRSLPASRPWPVNATRASRSSSRSNSNGLSRRDLRVALAVILGSVRQAQPARAACAFSISFSIDTGFTR